MYCAHIRRILLDSSVLCWIQVYSAHATGKLIGLSMGAIHMQHCSRAAVVCMYHDGAVYHQPWLLHMMVQPTFVTFVLFCKSANIVQLEQETMYIAQATSGRNRSGRFHRLPISRAPRVGVHPTGGSMWMGTGGMGMGGLGLPADRASSVAWGWVACHEARWHGRGCIRGGMGMCDTGIPMGGIDMG